jgi:signal transduction histidine kinase
VNAAATLSLVSIVAAMYVALLSRRVALAPGAGEQRWFAVVVFGSAAYALFNLATTFPGPPRVVFAVAGLSIAAVVLVTWGWIRFSQEFASVSPGRLERAVSIALLASIPVIALPIRGLTFSGEVVEHALPRLGVVYRQAVPTLFGDAAMAALLVVCAAVLVRLVRAWRRGVPHAGLVALAYAVMLAFALWDAVAVTFVLPFPVLLDFGWVAPVLAVWWMNTRRLVDSARSLERLRRELETEVEVRTRALSSAIDSLHQAEKLAALGRFASGVAHEVNNPAAAVTSALALIAESGQVRPGTEEADALVDARSAMERITALVRRLLDAAMVAVSRPGPGAREPAAVDVAAAVANVARALPDAVRAALVVDLAGAPAAHVRMKPNALEIVLEALVRNAADASGPGPAQPIELRALRRDDHVRLTVEDRGAGMTPDVLRQAFDPFFTTKPQGRGAGLGLAVARGLVQASGGTLVLESAPGMGTRAVLRLPAAAAPAAPA